MTGKKIVITGVSQGLGRAMTEGFIGAGHTVMGCARSEPAIAALQKQFGNPHDFATVDIADESQVMQWCDRLLQSYGAPDFLINNAAIINQPASLWNIPSADISRLIDINIKGTVYLIQKLVPAMISRGSGIIVNVSSGWGRSTSPEVGPYCASKWAIEGLTRSLAQELPAGLAAIALNPGVIHTEMLETCFGESAAAYTPLDEWGRAAIPYILSFSSRHNGQPLTVPA